MVPYARCRLHGDLLVMEYARVPFEGYTEEDGSVPYGYLTTEQEEWVSRYVDNRQVGYNRSRQLVVWDSAD